MLITPLYHKLFSIGISTALVHFGDFADLKSMSAELILYQGQKQDSGIGGGVCVQVTVRDWSLITGRGATK